MASTKPNRKCIICQRGYHYCPNCGSDSSKPTWYAIFDSENCNNIYNILTNYRDNVIDGATAKSKLAQCDLSDLEEFPAPTKAQIAEINGTVVKAVEDKVDVVNTKVEETKPEVKTDVKANNKPNFKPNFKVNK